MKTSQRGIDMLKGFEGLRLEAYQDSAGVWTIGYGHTGPDVEPGQRIDEDRAEVLLWTDLIQAEAIVKNWTLGLNQHQFDALVSFVFNLGSAPFTGETGIKTALISRYYADAAREILKWTKAKVNGRSRVLPGLDARRKAESRLFSEGIYPQQERSTLRRGSRGPAVLELRRLLARAGIGSAGGPAIFGPQTEAAVRLFQRRNGLVEDGVVGAKTWAALDKPDRESP